MNSFFLIFFLDLIWVVCNYYATGKKMKDLCCIRVEKTSQNVSMFPNVILNDKNLSGWILVYLVFRILF